MYMGLSYLHFYMELLISYYSILSYSLMFILFYYTYSTYSITYSSMLFSYLGIIMFSPYDLPSMEVLYLFMFFMNYISISNMYNHNSIFLLFMFSALWHRFLAFHQFFSTSIKYCTPIFHSYRVKGRNLVACAKALKKCFFDEIVMQN